MKSLCEDLISQPNAMEAREWLQTGRKRGFALVTLGELHSTEESLALVDKAYAAGAVRVTAVEIADYPAFGTKNKGKLSQNTGKLVIELPEDEPERADVLTWAGQIAEEQGFDATEDEGQRYDFVMLD
ncbi:MAG: hypothetical protein ACREFR_09650 [Limisphaerales bacterium]